MDDTWIIDVLADVRAFARKNDMPLLSAHLDEALLIAASETANGPQQPANWQNEPPAQLDTIPGE